MAKHLILHRALFFACALSACDSDDETRMSASSAQAGASVRDGAGSDASAGGAAAAGNDSGKGGTGAAAGSSSPADAPVGSFTHVYGQVFTTCKIDFCHGGGRAGLDMSSRESAYRTLVDMPSNAQAACGMLGKKRVVPGDPDESLLYLKLDINAPCGQQMPPGGVLSDAARQEIHDWIAAGAPDD